MVNPAAQMLKNISKLVCVSLGYFHSILNSFSATLASKYDQTFLLFLLFARLKIQLFKLHYKHAHDVTEYMLGEFQS
jgi:hypothetical protein